MKKILIIAALLSATSAHAGVRCSEFMGSTTCTGYGDDFGYRSRSSESMGSTTTHETYNGRYGDYQRTTRCSEFMGSVNCD
jgi:hypothetical protein